MNRTTSRRITAAVAAPLVAVGVLLGSISIASPPVAGAQPGDTRCSGMTMTDGQGSADSNLLTRAGQVGAASAPSTGDGSMPVNCQPASHG